MKTKDYLIIMHWAYGDRFNFNFKVFEEYEKDIAELKLLLASKKLLKYFYVFIYNGRFKIFRTLNLDLNLEKLESWGIQSENDRKKICVMNSNVTVAFIFLIFCFIVFTNPDSRCVKAKKQIIKRIKTSNVQK